MNKPVNISNRRKNIKDFYQNLLDIGPYNHYSDCYRLTIGTVDLLYRNEDFDSSDIHFDLLTDPEKATWMPLEKIELAEKIVKATKLFYNTHGIIYYPVLTISKVYKKIRRLYYKIMTTTQRAL